MKMTVTINDDLMKRVDEYVEENYMSRSGFLAMAANQFLNQYELIKTLRQVSDAVYNMAQDKELDDEAKQLLSDFESACRLMLGK